MLRRSTRRLVFWVVVCCYAVTAILVIGYARGYRVRLSPFAIARTGSVHVSATNRDVTVALDDAIRATRVPALITSVFPGTHRVRLSRVGSLPFEKNIRVEPLTTTFVNHIALLPDAPVVEINTSTPRVESPRDVGVSFLYRGKQSRRMQHEFDDVRVALIYSPFELWRVDEKNGQTSLLARMSNPIRQIVPVPDSGLLLVVQSNNIFALQLGDRDPEPFTLITGTDIRDATVFEKALFFTDIKNSERRTFQRTIR